MLEPDFWRGKRVLLTGHTGFKGAWAALWLERLRAKVTGLALAPDDEALFSRVGQWNELASNIVDVRDAIALRRVVDETQPEIVLHMAAQALVRDGYREPVETFSTNVLGTANLLEALRAHEASLQAIVVVTSDKCYLNLDTGEAYQEGDPLGGKDPYSASKACQEIVAHSFRQSYFSEKPVLATGRAGNVIGGGDFSRDRLIPDIVRARTKGERLELRYPSATRPWQHVLDPIFGYLLYAQMIAERHVVPVALNFAPPVTSVVPVHRVVAAFDKVWGGAEPGWDQTVDVDLVEAKALNLDASLAHRTIGWAPRLDLDDAVSWTAEWYKAIDGGADPKTQSMLQIARYEALRALV